jgi:signal peptide peptidase SppA
VTLDLLEYREWLIHPDALKAMAEVLRSHQGRDASLPSHNSEQPLLSVEQGVGTISIHGPIMRKPGVYSRVLLGATDSDEIGSAIEEAADRPDIKAVFLDIDSPGGTVQGTPELASAVSALNDRKPVYAFSSGSMCSAAYWIASQARAIYATPSARVGSIGVVQAVLDESQALANQGLKVEVFSVGKYKAMGVPGLPLSDEQRSLISSNLAEIASDFHAAVLARGRAIPAEALEGQSFSGRQAQRHNLAGLVSGRGEAMRRLRVYHASVDTGTQAMDTSIEDELASARAKVESLQAEGKAQAELLNEADASLESLRKEVAGLAQNAAEAIEQRDEAIAKAHALQEAVERLEQSQKDFDAKVSAEVARVVASTGTATPANVSPAGDNRAAITQSTSLEQLVAEYTRLVNANRPDEAAEFYHQHLSSHFTR